MFHHQLFRNAAVGFLLSVFSCAGLYAQNNEPVIGKTLAESKPGKAPELPIAKGAPNVIWILIDDSGFGATSAFGGGARTPVLESLAQNGLTYTNFHTTGVCSPSRAAMLAELKALFDQEAKANNVYPLINWSDLSIGITDFQRKAGLLPPAAAPKK